MASGSKRQVYVVCFNSVLAVNDGYHKGERLSGLEILIKIPSSSFTLDSLESVEREINPDWKRLYLGDGIVGYTVGGAD